MLFPQTNRCRTTLDLSGIWQLKADANDHGLNDGWANGFHADAEVGVPGSWNEQLSELGLMNYIGVVWYLTDFMVPSALSSQQIWMRCGSVEYHAQVWLNGQSVGEHHGGFLPFQFDITNIVKLDKRNRLVVRVDNRLSHDTIPQGVNSNHYAEFKKQRDETFPPTVFDFFPYGGIHRPVKLVALHRQHLSDVKVETRISGAVGQLHFAGQFSSVGANARLKAALWDGDRPVDEISLAPKSNRFSGEFEIADCRFWSQEDPHLYQVHFELFDGDSLVDEYTIDIGIREVRVTDTQLLLNGKPIFLKGFGRHEDFAVLGKGLSHPLLVKDFNLMKWLGANSFRTSHYPYSEEAMQMADRLGFLVIDEVPAVSLNFKYVNKNTLASHQRQMTELIARDRNHPSVIAWSIGNEPGIWGEEESISPSAIEYWKKICNLVKQLDTTRPVTAPTFAKWGIRDPLYQVSDFLSINRYWGWYEIPGDLEKAGAVLKSELETIYQTYHRPILISEFGADTIEGEHATHLQLFTEEYQTQLIKKYFEVIESLPFTIGEHIWNFADFRTAQHHRRVVMNKKGVFTRERAPKSAAFFVRQHWTH
ncbi:MAG TPA: beta-glucuronidase [bacterium]